MKPKIKYSQSYRTRSDKSNIKEISKNTIMINDWSLHHQGRNNVRLLGITSNHPVEHLNNVCILTSRIVEVKGLLVRTFSGNHYLLGKISAEYREWLCKNKPGWDPKNPITIKELQCKSRWF